MVLTASLLTDINSTTRTRIGALALYSAIGDDNTTPDPSDTTLGNELLRTSRTDIDVSVANKITVSGTVDTTEANGETIRENGWFDASSAGTMYCRNILTEILKSDSILLYLDTTVTVTVTEE